MEPRCPAEAHDRGWHKSLKAQSKEKESAQVCTHFLRPTPNGEALHALEVRKHEILVFPQTIPEDERARVLATTPDEASAMLLGPVRVLFAL